MAAGAVTVFYRGVERFSRIALLVTLITEAANILNRQEPVFTRWPVTESALTGCNRAMQITGFAHLVVALSRYARFALVGGGQEHIVIGMRR